FMSVVGIDLGNLNTVIAVARNRGIDIICNEVSNRSTPTMVGFGPKSRYLGEPAKTQEIGNKTIPFQPGNLKNTVSNMKRFIGRKPGDEEIESIEKHFVTSAVTEKD
ncbi:heat shock protein 70, partial [Rozella allomycis CSF55]